MSLPKERDQSSFFDVAFVVGSLFGANDRYRLFREKVMPALRGIRDKLDALYCQDNGRPAIDPVIMAGVTLLQFMEKVGDRKAAENVRLHLGWKFALGLAVDFAGFHHTSLVVFRERLLAAGGERVVFDGILDMLREEGLIKKRSKQRLDSTHVLGCVSEMSRLEVVRETIRLTLDEIEKQGLEEGFEDWAELVERYRESEIKWQSQSKEELTSKFLQAGKDALKLLEWLMQQSKELRDHDRVKLLQRVFDEQYRVSDEGVERRPKEESGTVKNPHDPDAQWSTKDKNGKNGWVGYKAQVVETVPDQHEPKPKGQPTEQFITEVTTTEAIASDIDGMQRSLEAQEEHGQERPSELFVDGAYVSDDTLAEAKEEDRELIGPARRSPEQGIFSSDQFDVDIEARRAVCPAGNTSTQCSRINDAHKGNEYFRFEWGSQCDTCPLQKECTKSKNGRRILSVGIHHDLLQERRREMEGEGFKETMRPRNSIEGTISELVRLGMRRTRYRGLAKTRLANYFTGAACNTNRWLRLLAWRASTAGESA